jgi:hypothetical protein
MWPQPSQTASHTNPRPEVRSDRSRIIRLAFWPAHVPAFRLDHIANFATLERWAVCSYSLPMNEIRPPRRRRAEKRPDLAPPGTPPHVAVAPALLDHKHVVIRADDDTEKDYAARQLLLDAALAFARKG